MSQNNLPQQQTSESHSQKSEVNSFGIAGQLAAKFQNNA
ncbi:MAG: hypothetical protein RLZZ433_1395, partial [Pseudomonadota bacterium]